MFNKTYSALKGANKLPEAAAPGKHGQNLNLSTVCLKKGLQNRSKAPELSASGPQENEQWKVVGLVSIVWGKQTEFLTEHLKVR